MRDFTSFPDSQEMHYLLDPTTSSTLWTKLRSSSLQSNFLKKAIKLPISRSPVLQINNLVFATSSQLETKLKANLLQSNFLKKVFKLPISRSPVLQSYYLSFATSSQLVTKLQTHRLGIFQGYHGFASNEKTHTLRFANAAYVSFQLVGEAPKPRQLSIQIYQSKSYCIS